MMNQISVLNGIRLLPLKESDAEELFQLVDKNREHLRNWLVWVDATKSPKDSKKFILSLNKAFTFNHQSYAKKICINDNIIGLIGCHASNGIDMNTELGYWLSKEFTGQGIMTRATQTFIQHLFEQSNLHRIIIRCAVGNWKSGAIPERLGFIKEGMQRQSIALRGEFLDAWCYSLLRSEWRIDNKEIE